MWSYRGLVEASHAFLPGSARTLAAAPRGRGRMGRRRSLAETLSRVSQLAALALPGLAPGLAEQLAARTDDLARGFVRAVRRRDWLQAAGLGRWLARLPDGAADSGARQPGWRSSVRWVAATPGWRCMSWPPRASTDGVGDRRPGRPRAARPDGPGQPGVAGGDARDFFRLPPNVTTDADPNLTLKPLGELAELTQPDRGVAPRDEIRQTAARALRRSPGTRPATVSCSPS